MVLCAEVRITMGFRITVAKMGKRQFEPFEHSCVYSICFTDFGMIYTIC